MAVNLHSLSSIISFVSWAGAGYFVFLRAWSNHRAKRFAAVAVCAGLWTLFPFLASITSKSSVLLLSARITYIGGILIPPTLLHFALVTTKFDNNGLNKLLLRTSYFLGFSFLPLLGLPSFFNEVVVFAPYFAVVPGPIYHAFVIYWLVVSSYAFGTLVVAHQRTTDFHEKNQLKYFGSSGFSMGRGLSHHNGSRSPS